MWSCSQDEAGPAGTEVCRRRVDLSVKVRPQALHMKGFSPVWMRWCRCSAFSCVNCFPHWSQQYGRSPGNEHTTGHGNVGIPSCSAWERPAIPRGWQGKLPGASNVATLQQVPPSPIKLCLSMDFPWFSPSCPESKHSLSKPESF